MSLASRRKEYLGCFVCGENNPFISVRRLMKHSRYRWCRFLVDSEVACWERLIWFALIALGGFCVVSMSLIISIRYQANYLTTLIDNTHHSVAGIPFPAVTLCHYNRIDIRKVDAAVDRFLPNSTRYEQKMLRVLIQRMNGLRFGSFSKLVQLREYDYRSFDHLNLSDLFQFTAYSCGDLLRECWWRSRQINCCELFTMSKSEYGYCYSFNSQAAPRTQYEKDHADLQWPLQTYRFGLGTGLRVLYGIDWKGYMELDREAGVSIIVHNTGEWPTNGRFIPAGNSITVAVEASQYKTSKRLRNLSPEDRQCYYDDLSIADEITDKVLHLKGLPYLRPNCIVECRRYYMMKYCNCSVSFFYPDHGYPPCTATGLKCLSHLNPILTYEKPKKYSPFFSQSDAGINCRCLPECFRVEYKYSVKPNYIWPVENLSTVDISIFFKRQEVIRYRTEKAYQITNLLANFGGIGSFFFGVSFLSVIEVFFFIISDALTKLKCKKWCKCPRIKLFRSKVSDKPTPARVRTIST